MKVDLRNEVALDIKKNIIEIGKRLTIKSLTHGTAGNISFKLSDKCILVSRRGVDLGEMTNDDIIKLDISGNLLEGKLQPTSEIPMHLEIYRKCPKTKAIIHAHPPFSTAFAVAGIPLDKHLLPEAVNIVGDVPIIKYCQPHSQELANEIAKALQIHNFLLMANHGIIGTGLYLKDICYGLEIIEFLCQVRIYTKILGKENEIPKD